VSGITHYSTLTALAVLGFYPTPVCYQRTFYAPILTLTSMERPYRFGTAHAHFRPVANWLRQEATATGCIARGEDAIPHRLVSLYSI
jgi:hypothetical protein